MMLAPLKREIGLLVLPEAEVHSARSQIDYIYCKPCKKILGCLISAWDVECDKKDSNGGN